MNWKRAFIAGAGGSLLMMSFMDICFMMGLTSFSFEQYLGSLLTASPIGDHNWTIGFAANLIVGAFFGMFYGYFFEYVFRRSGPRVGLVVGLAHAVLAAIAIFPFFNTIHDQMNVHPFPSAFGFFGFGLGPVTALLLLAAHLLFGATTGLFYGPVRAARERAKDFEPGETGQPGEKNVISYEDDPRDRLAV